MGHMGPLVHSAAFVDLEKPPVTNHTAVFCVALAAFYLLSWRHVLSMEAEEQEGADPVVPSAGQKKPRIDAFDSLRFFLIAYIASGHFIFTATKNPLLLNLISQINVVVGGFFVLSGYVAAYTTTELGQRKGSKRLDNVVEFAVPRIMGFLPLHLVVLLLFSPMFLWVDASFSGIPTAAWNGFLSCTLLQAWFPLSAEIWNAPTWFLSALSFTLIVLPFALRVLAVQRKVDLRRILVFLTLLSLLAKVSYSYDLNAWFIFEGTLSAKTHPNYVHFNATRFSPFAALLEMLMGATACRLVMLDSGKKEEVSGSSIPVLLAMFAILGLRATGHIVLNDMLIRSAAFIPLWILFLMRIHRESTKSSGPALLPRLLCSKSFLYMGSISFPIFIAHGPVGQVFYKKAVATKLWGQTMANPQPVGVHWFFAVYLLVVIGVAALLDKYFLQSAKVKQVSNDVSATIRSFFPQ